MKTIVLADDEPNLRVLVSTTLRNEDYRIIEAADGQSALDAVRREHPDLIILDWMMPGMTGIEVAEQLKADPLTAGIEVIMLTARKQDADLKRGEAAGVHAYLVKPFSPLELLRQVDDVLKSTDGGAS